MRHEDDEKTKFSSSSPRDDEVDNPANHSPYLVLDAVLEKRLSSREEMRGLVLGAGVASLGAQLCGPCFAPDRETAFVALQQSGESVDPKVSATVERLATRWPDFLHKVPPRPFIVALTRRGGGKIGT